MHRLWALMWTILFAIMVLSLEEIWSVTPIWARLIGCLCIGIVAGKIYYALKHEILAIIERWWYTKLIMEQPAKVVLTHF
ncbi:hypothetical protein LCGC14_0478960, partial [marine sediment metagenome]